MKTPRKPYNEIVIAEYIAMNIIGALLVMTFKTISTIRDKKK